MSEHIALVLMFSSVASSLFGIALRLRRIERQLSAIEEALFEEPDDDDPVGNEEAPVSATIVAIAERKAA